MTRASRYLYIHFCVCVCQSWMCRRKAIYRTWRSKNLYYNCPVKVIKILIIVIGLALENPLTCWSDDLIARNQTSNFGSVSRIIWSTRTEDRRLTVNFEIFFPPSKSYASFKLKNKWTSRLDQMVFFFFRWKRAGYNVKGGPKFKKYLINIYRSRE